MRNRGVRRPGLAMVVCLVLAAGGAAAIAWGAATMEALGGETGATAASIAFGLLAAILGGLFFFNFLWAWRIVRAMRRGEGVIARWVVAPAAFERFRDAEAARRGAGNDYRLPRRTPKDGLEVIFSADAVLIGGTLFGLASTGLSRFTSARMAHTNPPCIEFGTKLSWVSSQPRMQLHHRTGNLRVPIADDAHLAAARILSHYLDVIARRTIVKPRFWTVRIRIGQAAILLGAAAAAAGFALRGSTVPVEFQVGLAVGGTIVALGGGVLALAAASLRARQHRR